MLRRKREKGEAAVLAAAAGILLFTLFIAAPNAQRTMEILTGLYLYLQPPGRTSDVKTTGQTRQTEEPCEENDPAQADPTPPDIRERQALFARKQTAYKAAGTVTERLFTTNGATDQLGNIAIKNGTSTLHPDFEALLCAAPHFPSSTEEKPLVLVYHTHTTESYQLADDGLFYTDGITRSTDPAVNMVRIGSALCEALEKNGVACVHDTQIYDDPYTGAYRRSRINVQKQLEEHPSIRITLDVHRDAVYDSADVAVKPTARIDGRKTAQIMILTGAEEGSATDFPNWQSNLSFALALQQKAQTAYPGLMRPLFFCPRRYNLDLVPYGLLLEIGSDANTLEEAYSAARLMGRALAALINENKQ